MSLWGTFQYESNWGERRVDVAPCDSEGEILGHEFGPFCHCDPIWDAETNLRYLVHRDAESEWVDAQLDAGPH